MRVTKAQLEEKVKALELELKVLELELEEANKAIDRLNAREAELLTLLRYRARVTPKLDRTKVSPNTCVRCGERVSEKVAERSTQKLGWTYCVACQAAAERYQTWRRQREAAQTLNQRPDGRRASQPVKTVAKTRTVKTAGLKCSCGAKVTPGVAKYSRDKFDKVLCMPCQEKARRRA